MSPANRAWARVEIGRWMKSRAGCRGPYFRMPLDSVFQTHSPGNKFCTSVRPAVRWQQAECARIWNGWPHRAGVPQTLCTWRIDRCRPCGDCRESAAMTISSVGQISVWMIVVLASSTLGVWFAKPVNVPAAGQRRFFEKRQNGNYPIPFGDWRLTSHIGTGIAGAPRQLFVRILIVENGNANLSQVVGALRRRAASRAA